MTMGTGLVTTGELLGRRERKKEVSVTSTSSPLHYHAQERATAPGPHTLLCWWMPDLPNAARGEQPEELGHTQRQTEDTQ